MEKKQKKFDHILKKISKMDYVYALITAGYKTSSEF